jgi:hypothetical protein
LFATVATVGFELEHGLFSPAREQGDIELSQREAGSLMGLLLFVSARI